MYKLIITDDEKIIRTGLKNMIDWNKLGFEDNRSVLRWTGSHPESLDSMVPGCHLNRYQNGIRFRPRRRKICI